MPVSNGMSPFCVDEITTGLCPSTVIVSFTFPWKLKFIVFVEPGSVNVMKSVSRAVETLPQIESVNNVARFCVSFGSFSFVVQFEVPPLDEVAPLEDVVPLLLVVPPDELPEVPEEDVDAAPPELVPPEDVEVDEPEEDEPLTSWSLWPAQATAIRDESAVRTRAIRMSFIVA